METLRQAKIETLFGEQIEKVVIFTLPQSVNFLKLMLISLAIALAPFYLMSGQHFWGVLRILNGLFFGYIAFSSWRYWSKCYHQLWIGRTRMFLIRTSPLKLLGHIPYYYISKIFLHERALNSDGPDPGFSIYLNKEQDANCFWEKQAAPQDRIAIPHSWFEHPNRARKLLYSRWRSYHQRQRVFAKLIHGLISSKKERRDA